MYNVRIIKKDSKIGVVVGDGDDPAEDAPVPLNIIPNMSTSPLVDSA